MEYPLIICATWRYIEILKEKKTWTRIIPQYAWNVEHLYKIIKFTLNIFFMY